MSTVTGWTRKPLSDVVDILDARRIPVNGDERAKRLGDVPYLGATGQVGWIDKAIFDEELVLLGEDGAPFLDPAKSKAYLVDGPAWVNNHAHVLRAKGGLTNRFLLHQLNTLDYRPYVSGSTRLKLPQGPMKQISLLIPPEYEQIQIVAEIEKQFTRLDAGVAALRRVQANLKRYRAAVLKAACEGRLVPTEAALARRESRSYETGTQLRSRIVERRRISWRGRGDSTVPEVEAGERPLLPEGWAWASLEQLLTETMCNGISVKGSDDPPGVRALRLSAMSDSGFDYTDIRYLPLAANDVADLWIQRGDFFVSRGNGSLHLVCRGTEAGTPTEPTIFPDTMIRLRFSGDLQKTGWIRTIWSSRFVRIQIEANVKTTAGIYKIAQPQLGRVVVPLPPLAEQHRIVAEVERRLSVVDELDALVAANLKRATRLRQAVLQRAFSGGLATSKASD